MAKRSRTASQAQRDRSNKETAIQLKKAGILSKQAKLNRSYISKEVLAKVRQYQYSANLDYKAHTVTKEVARAAKERGYQVVGGNKIIGPKSRQFANRLAKGELTGVRPVKGGMMEEVILPHTVFDMQSLVNQLGEGIDSLKDKDEWFAFKYKGGTSMRIFRDTQDLLDHLTHYQSSTHEVSQLELFRSNQLGRIDPELAQEVFDNFSIFRLHPADQKLNIPSRSERERRRLARIAQMKAEGRWKNKNYYKSRAQRLAVMEEHYVQTGRIEPLDRLKAKFARQDKKKYEKLKADPVKWENYKAKKSASAKARRARNKAQNGGKKK